MTSVRTRFRPGRQRERAAPAGVPGGHRAAVVVPVVLLLLGLAAGGVTGWRSVTGRTVRAPTPPAPPPLAVSGAEGPIEQLRGLGELAWMDDGGVVRAVTSDGRAQRTLGRADQLTADPETNPSSASGQGRAMMSPDGAIVYGYLADGSPVAVRLVEGQVRRLSPPGTVAAAPTRQSADGAMVAVCAGEPGSGPGRVERATGEAARSTGPGPTGGGETTLLDPGGRQLASLPDCALDLARDGQAALVPEAGGADRGLRLWHRSGGYRNVLGADAVAAAARTVEFDADPGDFAVGNAWLSPDGRQALVSIHPKMHRQSQDVFWRQGAALLLVDLSSRRWQAIPVELPGAYPVVWGPAGGYAYAQTFETGTFRVTGRPTVSYVPAKGRPVLLEAGRRHDNLRIEFSPDGDWLLFPDSGNWTFVRVDDPSTRVSYAAPGDFVGWLPGKGSR
ncbi:MAG TPA: hypothetical protein VG276_25285 [Actinomycetes bacterium]|jgi:hypothetical protein|nr:hypothetical protein [Actinomycetes bacterium]